MNSLYKLLLILSPIPAALISGFVQSRISLNPGNMGTGVILLLVVVLGIPFIAVSGLTISIFSRNSIDADKRSMTGYLIPAIITWVFALSAVFS